MSGRQVGHLETRRAEITARSADVNTRQRGTAWHVKIGEARRKLKGFYPNSLS